MIGGCFVFCMCYATLLTFWARPRLPLFPSFEEELEFLEDYNLGFAQAALLETHGRYLEAADLHLSENRPLDAIRDLLKEKGSREVIQKATKILLEALWLRCSFAISPKQVAADQDVAVLLNLAHQLPIDFLDPLDRHEVCFHWQTSRITHLS